MKKVIVVGSLNVDLTVYTPRFPVAGESLVGSSLKIGMGGKGNNQATAAHRAGGAVHMVGRIGRDAMADVVKKHYKAEGMAEDYISVSDTVETGTALIEVEDAGQNRIVVIPGANNQLAADQVQAAAADLLPGGDIAVVLTQLETGFAPIYAAKELARQAGALYIINPAPYKAMPADLLAGTDWLTPNETEAAALTGVQVTDKASAAAAAHAIQAMGVKNVLITLGSQGVYALWDSGEELLPAPTVKAVDTTGAGDAFNGAFAVALAEGKPVPAALRFACCCASLSVTKYGAAPAMPHRPEIDALVEKTYG